MESSLPTLSNMIDPDNEEKTFLNEKKEVINSNKKEEKQVNSKEVKNEIIQENKNIDKKEKTPDSKKEKTKTQLIEKEEEKEIKEKELKKANVNIEENNKNQKNFIFENNKNEDNSNESNNNLKKLIKELKEIELSGNQFYKKKSFDEAINKYKEGYDIINKELYEVNRNRMYAYHPEIKEFISLSKIIMSSLSLSYINKGKYEESIEVDKKIFSLDPKYDKSYARLFKSYLKLNKKAEAVFFGDILINNFNDEVKANYKDLIPIIEKEKKNLEIEYEIELENKKKEARKYFLKFAIPFVIFIISLVYFRLFKK